MTDNSNDKPVDEVTIGRSRQLDFFEVIDFPGPDDDISNTIELYDSLPKYVWDRNREHKDLDHASKQRSCKLHGQDIEIEIRPAMIEKRGRTVLIYPGVREEIVEDVLRKFTVNGQGRVIDGQVGVMFTLYQLKKELHRVGHSYNLNEIKEAIAIARGTQLKVWIGKETVVDSNLFPMVGLTTRGEFRRKRGDAKCYVQFNPLVTQSINETTFRQYNLGKGMDFRNNLARFIFKRMCHYWKGASPDARGTYNPKLISFLSQTPRGLSNRMSENIRAMKMALDCLLEHKIISHYDADRIKKGRKVIDIQYTIYAHESFTRDMKASNHLQYNLVRQSMDKHRVIDHELSEEKGSSRVSYR